MINSYILTTKQLIYKYKYCKEKMEVDKRVGSEKVNLEADCPLTSRAWLFERELNLTQG